MLRTHLTNYSAEQIQRLNKVFMNLVAKLAPSDEGDSPLCGEMSRSDRGDRRRQRLAAKQTEGEKN